MAYTGSRHHKSRPVQSVIAASQVRPDQNPHALPAASAFTLNPATGVAAAGGTTITVTTTRNAENVRRVEVGAGFTPATNLIVISKTQFSFVAPAQAAGARDVLFYGTAGDVVTKTGGLTYV